MQACVRFLQSTSTTYSLLLEISFKSTERTEPKQQLPPKWQIIFPESVSLLWICTLLWKKDRVWNGTTDPKIQMNTLKPPNHPHLTRELKQSILPKSWHYKRNQRKNQIETNTQTHSSWNYNQPSPYHKKAGIYSPPILTHLKRQCDTMQNKGHPTQRCHRPHRCPDGLVRGEKRRQSRCQ